jgi:large subunit ribosomal protein L30
LLRSARNDGCWRPNLIPTTIGTKLETENKMKKIKITLVKSPIDRPERQKLTLQALGLNKTNSVKEVEATPQVLGMIRKVEHLVKVEESK